MVALSSGSAAATMFTPAGADDSQSLAWYVIHTCSRQEVRVEAGLRRKGLEIFLPRVTVPSRRRDRSRLLKVPLFPGYLFAHTDLSFPAYYAILRHQGVVRILGIKGRCVPVPEDTVAAIHAVVESGRPFYPWPYLKQGMRVQIIEGPLTGATGIIWRKKPSQRRLVVGVELLGRAVAVDLEEEAVQPLA